MSFIRRNAPLLVLVLGACIIAFAALLVRLTETGPAAAGFWRLTLALPWLIILAIRERSGDRKPVSRRTGSPRLGAKPLVLFACGATFAADLVFWHYSLRLTSVANSTVLANLTPVVVTALAWIFLRERPAPVFLAGLALAVVGAAVMALAHHSGGQGSNAALGDGLALITTLWYGLYFLAVREARKTASTLQVMLASTVVGAPLLLGASLLLHERIWPAGPAGWAACAALGLVHVGGQGALAWALGKVSAAMAAVVVLVQPVAAALLSWAIFGEAVSPVQALGALLALAGVAVAQATARRPTPLVPGEAEGFASKG